MIPKTECVPGMVYRLKSRNLELGVWTDGTHPGFIGIRTKFDNRYLDKEYHVENGPPFGTASPVEALISVPADIPLTTDLGSVCGVCGAAVRYLTVDDPARSPDYELNWKCDSGCLRAYGQKVANEALFNWLEIWFGE